MRWIAAALIGLVVTAVVALVLTSGDAPTVTATPDDAGSVGAGGALSVAPVRTVVTADEPRVTIPYILSNDGPQDRAYAIQTLELETDGSPAAPSPDGAQTWVDVESDEIVVESGESRSIPVEVVAPPNRGVEERRIGIAFAPVTRGDQANQVEVTTRVVTSVYVQGTGATETAVRLQDLRAPRIATGAFTVTATLVNEGTVTVIPGAAATPVTGTLSAGGGRFTLAADPVRPATRRTVTGTADDLPFACWCQVKVSAPDGDGGTEVVQTRVLIVPWWSLATVAILLLLATILIARSRRAARGSQTDDTVPA